MKGRLVYRATWLFVLAYVLLCGLNAARANFLQFYDTGLTKTFIAGAGPEETYQSHVAPLPSAVGQDVLEKCASLLSEGVVCMFVNSPGFALPHKSAEMKMDTEIDGYQILNHISPSAGMFDLSAAEHFSNFDFNDVPQDDYSQETITKSAMLAAVEMVRDRYTDAIYQAHLNGKSRLDTQEVMALTEGTLAAAAESAFDDFIRENFGKRDFEGRSYDDLRSFFLSSFQHAAISSVQSLGSRLISDMTSGGEFKSLSIRSEIIDKMESEFAKNLIDSGLEAAKNSQYAFLRNLEVSFRLREDSKPEYSVLTVQPLYSSDGKKHNLFAQAAFSNMGSRNSLSGGLGYRYMPDSEDYVVGGNLFIDYERPFGHVRAGTGLDLQTSLWGVSTNFYKGLTDWRGARTGFQERAMDGFDLQVSGRMPFLPALEVFGRGYRWQGIGDADDIDGKELRVEYSPVPALTIDGSFSDENGRDSQLAIGLRYNYVFGAPAEYLFDWDEQFRKKSASEYIFRKIRRENTIRVQERVDPELAASSSSAPLAALVSFSPVNGATGVSVGTNVSFTFDQDVQAGTGNIVFTDLTDGSDNFTIPVADARVSIVNDTVTFDLSAQLLDFLSNYEVTFASGVFEDLSGNSTAPLTAGTYSFTTIVDPTAGFPAPTLTMAPNSTSANHEDAQDVGTWQMTINIGANPDGVIFESGATGQGIAAAFDAVNLVFAAGDGATTSTGVDSIFGTYPVASIGQGLHHFVFVADPDAPAEIGLYIDGIRVINESIAGSMQSGEWAGTNGAGYGQVNSSIRAGVDTSNITGATLTSNLSFYSGSQPADF